MAPIVLPARERLIPKRSGKLRSLGISTVRDRIVQTAAKLVLERVEAMARTDVLTGLPNRRAWDEELRREMGAPGGMSTCWRL